MLSFWLFLFAFPIAGPIMAIKALIAVIRERFRS